MSTRSTIFLTYENEHWFHDCGYEYDKNEKVITGFLDLEILHKNAEIVCNDEESFCIRVYAGSDLHKCIERADYNRTVIAVHHLHDNQVDFLGVINDENTLNLVTQGLELLDTVHNDYALKIITVKDNKGNTSKIHLNKTYTR